MKFKIITSNGKEKVINAKNVDEAELKADKLCKKWVDVILIDKHKGEEIY